jgi:hypothetical protein
MANVYSAGIRNKDLGAIMLVLIVFIGFACFLAGVFLGGVFFESASKAELRKRFDEAYDIKPSTFSESRLIKRHPIIIQAKIKAPTLDSAGIPTESEQFECIARITDISKNGIGVLSDRFFKKGLVLQISCDDKMLQLKDRKAQVRNVSVKPNGIRTGLEFIVPLEV